jgi:hypothetical protein
VVAVVFAGRLLERQLCWNPIQGAYFLTMILCLFILLNFFLPFEYSVCIQERSSHARIPLEDGGE